MTEKLANIDVEHLEVNAESKGDLHVKVEEDVLIIVTQAFGPRGDDLMGVGDVEFDGYPAVTVKVKVDGEEGLVHLSPFHGDRRKQGFIDISDGARCELFCPVSGEPLDKILDADGDDKPGYYAIYLTPALNKGEAVLLSDIWNDYSSRIIDNNELLSQWNNRAR